MAEPKERTVETALGPVRVWEKGRGKKLGYLAGLGGLRKWPAFLDKLAETRRVIVPSLPGFPGGPSSEPLDGQLDWVLATHDTLGAAGLFNADLVGASVGGELLAEFAALWPASVRKLVLIAPFGLYDADDPVADVFAQRPGAGSAFLSEKPAAYDAFVARPEGEDEVEWDVVTLRANIAAAAVLWPLGDTRLAKRLGRIDAETLLIWGEKDRAVPPSYAKRFASGIAGKARTRIVKNAGHVVEIDQPGHVASAIARFLDG